MTDSAFPPASAPARDLSPRSREQVLIGLLALCGFATLSTYALPIPDISSVSENVLLLGQGSVILLGLLFFRVAMVTLAR